MALVSKEYAKVLADLDTCLNNNASELKECLERIPRRQKQRVAVLLIERHLNGNRQYRLDDILKTLGVEGQDCLCAFNRALRLCSYKEIKNEATVDFCGDTPDCESDCQSDVMSGITWRSGESNFSDVSTVLSQISWDEDK